MISREEMGISLTSLGYLGYLKACVSMWERERQLMEKANPSLLSQPDEEEGTRMKEGKEEHFGRGSSDWLLGFQNLSHLRRR